MKRDMHRLREALAESFAENPTSHAGEHEIARRAADPRYLECRLKRICYVLHLLGNPTQPLLDASSGNGLNAVLALLSGASEVYAVEVDPEQYRLGQSVASKLGLDGRLHTVAQDILQADLPLSVIGGAFSFEFLEHISDIVRFHELAFKWLVPGGRIYGRSGANAANPWKMRFFRRHHLECDVRYMLPRRTVLIRELLPNAADESVANLAERTRGMLLAEIREAALRWESEGTLPEANPLRVPRDPWSGYYEERPLVAWDLVRDIRSAGFSAKMLRPNHSFIYHSSRWRGAVLQGVGALLSAFYPLSAFACPWVEVLGEKPRGASRS